MDDIPIEIANEIAKMTLKSVDDLQSQELILPSLLEYVGGKPITHLSEDQIASRYIRDNLRILNKLATVLRVFAIACKPLLHDQYMLLLKAVRNHGHPRNINLFLGFDSKDRPPFFMNDLTNKQRQIHSSVRQWVKTGELRNHMLDMFNPFPRLRHVENWGKMKYFDDRVECEYLGRYRAVFRCGDNAMKLVIYIEDTKTYALRFEASNTIPSEDRLQKLVNQLNGIRIYDGWNETTLASFRMLVILEHLISYIKLPFDNEHRMTIMDMTKHITFDRSSFDE